MKKLKNNKLRNTGLLYEILTKNVMYEVINEEKQLSIPILKKHFKAGSQLASELCLYQTLIKETKNDPNELLKITLESRRNLNLKKLEKEKYDLIKSINKSYDIKTFFETRVSNYKLSAAIFKLFEYDRKVENPDEYLTSKNLVLETVSGKAVQVVEDEVETLWRQQDKDTRVLAFKLLIEKFNEQYKGLNQKQRQLLTRFINEDVSNPKFRNYVLSEVSDIVSKLTQLKHKVDDGITKIKLNETIELASVIVNSPNLKDEHLSSILKYYELIDELSKK